jgi:hypothetical protein
MTIEKAVEFALASFQMEGIELPPSVLTHF